MPGVAYQFFVYGKNSLGKGNNSQKLIIKTKGELSFFDHQYHCFTFQKPIKEQIMFAFLIISFRFRIPISKKYTRLLSRKQKVKNSIYTELYVLCQSENKCKWREHVADHSNEWQGVFPSQRRDGGAESTE